MGCREQGLFHFRARLGPASSWSHPGDQTPLVDKPSGPSILRPLSPCEQLSPSASHSQGLLLPLSPVSCTRRTGYHPHGRAVCRGPISSIF